MKFDVYGLGNALVDLQVAVDHEVVEKTGNPPGSMALVDEVTRDRILELVKGEKVMPSAGGSVANSLVGIVTLGGTPCFTGSIHDDAHGRSYTDSLEACGVEFRAQYSDRASGVCIVLITPDAQRTMLTNLGCAAEITREGVSEEAIQSSHYLYVEGYLWDGPRAIDACRHAMQLARTGGTRVAFTASDSFCVERHHDDYVDILENHADLYFANADEARALVGVEAPGDAARRMAERCGLAAVTDGGNGVYIASRSEVIHVPAVPTEPVDTTGAGDAFAGGFLHGLTHGRSLEEAARAGVQLATRVISRFGARPV